LVLDIYLIKMFVSSVVGSNIILAQENKSFLATDLSSKL